MLKKLTIIVFVQVYLFSIIGVTLKYHECEGESSIEIFGFVFGENCCCEHESDEHQNDCCHEDIKTIQADNGRAENRSAKIYNWFNKKIITNDETLIDNNY